MCAEKIALLFCHPIFVFVSSGAEAAGVEEPALSPVEGISAKRCSFSDLLFRLCVILSEAKKPGFRKRAWKKIDQGEIRRDWIDFAQDDGEETTKKQRNQKGRARRPNKPSAQ